MHQIHACESFRNSGTGALLTARLAENRDRVIGNASEAEHKEMPDIFFAEHHLSQTPLRLHRSTATLRIAAAEHDGLLSKQSIAGHL